MSLSLNSLDLLSFSPCLISVLHLLEYKDILNCKLVNRRFHQLVQRNYHHLPRALQSFTINTKMDEQGSNVEYVQIILNTDYNDDKYVYIYITSQRLRIKYTMERPVIKYYKLNGVPSDDKSNYPYEKEIEERYRYDEDSENIKILTVDYEIRNLMDAVQDLLHFLISNFAIFCIHIDRDARWIGNRNVYNTPGDLKNMLRDIMEEHKSECLQLMLNNFCGIEEFVDIIMVKLGHGSIRNFMRTISMRKRSFFLNVDYGEYGTELLELIQAWDRLDYPINQIRISGPLNSSLQEIISAITSSLSFTFHRFHEDQHCKTDEIFIRRQSDNSVIRLSHRNCDYSGRGRNVFRFVDIEHITLQKMQFLEPKLDIPFHEIGLK